MFDLVKLIWKGIIWAWKLTPHIGAVVSVSCFLVIGYVIAEHLIPDLRDIKKDVKDVKQIQPVMIQQIKDINAKAEEYHLNSVAGDREMYKAFKFAVQYQGRLTKEEIIKEMDSHMDGVNRAPQVDTLLNLNTLTPIGIKAVGPIEVKKNEYIKSGLLLSKIP